MRAFELLPGPPGPDDAQSAAAVPLHASLPGWPRRLPLRLAAAYLGISPSTLRRGVEAGRYPAPIRDGRRILWDRRRLDEFVDRQSGCAGLEPW